MSVLMCRSHDRRVAPKAVKFSSTVTEFPDYSRYDEEAWSGGVTSKSGPSHKYSPSHSGAVNHASQSHGSGHSSGHSNIGHSGSGHASLGHSASGHASLGQHVDRSIPDGEPGHGKSDTRKSSTEKQ